MFVFSRNEPLVKMLVVELVIRCDACNLHGVLQFLLDRTEIHGRFNDFLVGRELFGVHRQEERPGLVLLLQLFE